jgi:hypothetical protein
MSQFLVQVGSSEGDGSRPSPRSPRRPRPTRRSLALPQGCLQPRAISTGSLEPVRSGTSASESVINVETVLPNEDQRSEAASGPSCRLTCVKQQSRSVPTARAQRRHDLSRQQTARRLEAQVAIGADSTAVRCAGVLPAMSNHTWVGATSVNSAFPAERESARASNALPHRTTSDSRRRRVSETPARPGEAADGDSAAAVFQSVHMHRQVVAFSTLAIEQTPAAPGFVHKQQPVGAAADDRFARRDVAGRTIELATLRSSRSGRRSRRLACAFAQRQKPTARSWI